MVNQKPISLKIDLWVLKELDKEVSTSWRKRNWHINQAIKQYLDAQDTRRRIKCAGTQGDREGYLQDYEDRWFPHVRK